MLLHEDVKWNPHGNQRSSFRIYAKVRELKCLTTKISTKHKTYCRKWVTRYYYKAYRTEIAKWQKSLLSIITLNINQIPVKRDWKNDVENIIGLYAIYRRLTSDPKKQVS